LLGGDHARGKGVWGRLPRKGGGLTDMGVSLIWTFFSHAGAIFFFKQPIYHLYR
jgi:hypothetical protein